MVAVQVREQHEADRRVLGRLDEEDIRGQHGWRGPEILLEPFANALLGQGVKRTSDLLRQISGISPKMLTQTLKKLEAARLVARTVYPVVPPKVEYSLTDTGRELEEVLAKLYDWSVKRTLANN
nr:hypothetical protein [Tanacetum cinerariifolium]